MQAGANVNHVNPITRENLLVRAVCSLRPEVLRALLSYKTNNVSTACIDLAFIKAVNIHCGRTPDLSFSGTLISQPMKKLNQVNCMAMICQLIPKVSDYSLVSDHSVFDKCVRTDDHDVQNSARHSMTVCTFAAARFRLE